MCLEELYVKLNTRLDSINRSIGNLDEVISECITITSDAVDTCDRILVVLDRIIDQ